MTITKNLSSHLSNNNPKPNCGIVPPWSFLPSILNKLYLPLILSLALSAPCLAQESAPSTPNNPTPQPEETNPPEGDRSLDDGNTVLSLEGGKKLMADANQAISSTNYEAAASNLQKARQVFNQLTNFYLDLSKSFNGLDNRVSEENRRKAAEAGQMRDEATYQLALVHRAQNKPELSVPLLIQVIRSQNPSSDLGQRSYQQLYELGFVNTPFSPANNPPPVAPAAPTAPTAPTAPVAPKP